MADYEYPCTVIQKIDGEMIWEMECVIYFYESESMHVSTPYKEYFYPEPGCNFEGWIEIDDEEFELSLTTEDTDFVQGFDVTPDKEDYQEINRIFSAIVFKNKLEGSLELKGTSREKVKV